MEQKRLVEKKTPTFSTSPKGGGFLSREFGSCKAVHPTPAKKKLSLFQLS